MLSIEASSSDKSGAERTPGAGWRVQCLSPNRTIIDEVNALLVRALPGTSPSDARAYPEARELPHVLGPHLPNLLLLDVITDSQTGMALIPDVLKLDASIHIITLLPPNQSELMLGSLRHGAADFLIQPFTPDQFEGVLAKLARTLPKDKQQPKELAKIYCVMPAKGACGASTLACNIAHQWKRHGAKRILLADMDPLTGTLSFLLKVKSTYSFLDVLGRADTLDADLWKAMVTNRQGVDVLLAPEMLIEGVNDVRDATPIIDYARQNYDIVVLDTNSVYGDWNLSQAKLCDELLLITTNELPALQAAQRALLYLDSHRVGRWKTKVVVNRYEKEVGLTREVIGTALHTDIFHVVPSDYEAVQKALLEGKAIPTKSSLGRSLSTLGDRLAGKEKEAAKKSSSLGSLLSLFSRTSS
jgi:pilus assembly protein CpaE